MSFEVTILGSGAAIPTQRRNPTSQYIVCNDRHILIDCGEGTQMQIRKYGVKFQRINHILISHLHGDHFFGLVGLISTMHLMGRDKGLSIYGPEELEQILRLQLEVGAAKLDFEINFVKLNGKDSGVIFEDKLIEISYFPLKHRIPTNGFVIREKVKERRLNPLKIEGSGLQFEHMHRLKKGEDILLENGKTLKNAKYTLDPHPSFSYAYCSDTAYAEKIVSYIQGVSLLYHEATFIEKDIERARATFHSTARQAAEIAKKAGVGKLIVGHLSARYDSTSDHLHEAMQVFENSEVVEDGRTYQVS
ncbi:MAG: ribonuclease Z [Crocinitomicaceae bacterium]|nr:ribonuclease Z [Crocinitomicaceae bacterium]MDP4865243.1 ribonuclease Z [Crocinitomicaceae bacterium]MDP5011857.1 ribonuclease Z [Crocinitomicaceae bacterium]